jgi:hypothetical protein
MTNIYRPLRLPLTVATALVTLTACEDEITDPGAVFVEGQLTLDASSNASYVYASLANGGSTVAVTDPFSSTDWHLAFRRFSVKLNGGVAGPSDVAGANLMNNANATDAEVVAFTEADADAAWEAVTEADIAGATFIDDGIIEDTSGPWFRFDPMAQNLVANPGAAWKVDTSGDGYAVFRVSELVMAGFDPESVEIEYRYQSPSGSLGSIGTVDVDLTGGPGSVDFATGTVVTPSGCNWDLVVTPSFSIDFNDACGAGSFPLDSSEDFTTITSAAGAPEYGGFLSVVSGAFPSSVEDATGIFWYNIEGNNRMWPTYNVFLVRVGTDVYKVQVLDYYSSTGASGHPTIRFLQLQ